MTWSRVIGFIIKIKLRLTLNKAPTLDIDIVRILWRIFKWWIFLNRMWSFALEHRAHWIDRSFKWQTRKFLAHFWHLRNSIKAEDQIDISFQGNTLSSWVIVACCFHCYFNFMSTSHQEIHFPMIIPFLRVFSCHFEPLVHRQHWLALKIEYLFSSESLTIEIGDPGAPWGCWDVSPDMTRSEEMWWGWSLWERYSREYFMTTTDPRSVMISTLRLLRPWLCCYNNYYYTGAGNE